MQQASSKIVSSIQPIIEQVNIGQPIRYDWLGEKNNHKAALSMRMEPVLPKNSSTKAVSSKPLDSLDIFGSCNE